ncbi:MAG: hypothetical protein LBJ20_05540 [Candidatus Methanoplasma sp.]|jgi:hypothetical protein|nr:hypothetical protein [Candidatus Methanoplasma sp.]
MSTVYVFDRRGGPTVVSFERDDECLNSATLAEAKDRLKSMGLIGSYTVLVDGSRARLEVK